MEEGVVYCSPFCLLLLLFTVTFRCFCLLYEFCYWRIRDQHYRVRTRNHRGRASGDVAPAAGPPPPHLSGEDGGAVPGSVGVRLCAGGEEGKGGAFAGGNGGRGGDVILECSRSIWDFSSLQHHMKAGRGGHGVSKNQIGTSGSDKITQVPVCTVIHLVRGEQPSLAVNKPTRALDPRDIPDAADHSPASSSRMKSKMMKGLDGILSSQQIAPNDSTDGNEAERGNNNQWEKQTYFNTCSKIGFSSTEDCDVSSYPHQVENDEKDQFKNEDEEFCNSPFFGL